MDTFLLRWGFLAVMVTLIHFIHVIAALFFSFMKIWVSTFPLICFEMNSISDNRSSQSFSVTLCNSPVSFTGMTFRGWDTSFYISVIHITCCLVSSCNSAHFLVMSSWAFSIRFISQCSLPFSISNWPMLNSIDCFVSSIRSVSVIPDCSVCDFNDVLVTTADTNCKQFELSRVWTPLFYGVTLCKPLQKLALGV